MHKQSAHRLDRSRWGSCALLQPQIMKQLLLLGVRHVCAEARHGVQGWPEKYAFCGRSHKTCMQLDSPRLAGAWDRKVLPAPQAQRRRQSLRECATGALGRCLHRQCWAAVSSCNAAELQYESIAGGAQHEIMQAAISNSNDAKTLGRRSMPC